MARWRPCGPLTHKPYRERPADVAARLRRILVYVPDERLWAVPDCGLWETPRWLAFSKLQALVQGAAAVRRELIGGGDG